MALQTAAQFQPRSTPLQSIASGIDTIGQFQRLANTADDRDRQFQIRDALAKAQSGGEAEKAQFRQQFPQEAQQFESNQLKVEKQKFDSMNDRQKQRTRTNAEDFLKLQGLGSDQEKIAQLERTRERNILAGLDNTETNVLLNAFFDNPESANSIIDSGVSVGERLGIIKSTAELNRTTAGASTKSFQPITLVNKKTKEKRLVTPTFDPKTNKAVLSPFDIPEGFEVSKETAGEKRAADVVSKRAEKGAEITGKGIATRRQSAIQQGLDAADGFANIQRGIDLLSNVKTGGLDNLKLKASNLFGVTGADEAELSNRLSKAVLSQLRATFGAAFTAQEGQQLTDIEAGFGKSTEGNLRLLNQTKRIIERAARRGIRAAKAIGDQDTVDDINEALEFSLDVSAQSDLNPQEQEELTQLRALKAQQSER